MNEQAAKAAIQAAIRSGDYAEAARLAGQLAEQIDRRAPASSTKAKAPASSSSSSTKAKAPAAASSTKAKAPAAASSTKAKAAPAAAGTAVPRSQASAAERQAAQRAAQRAEAAVVAAERGAQRAAERAAALRAEAGQATGARRAQLEARAGKWASRAREGKAAARLRGEVAAELRSRVPEAAPAAARGPVKGTDYDRARATVRRARAAEERARAKGDAAGAAKAAARREAAERSAEQARARARSRGERLSARGDRADKSRTGDRGRRSGELGGGVWRSGRKAGELLPASQAVSGIFDKVKQSSIGETHGIHSVTVKDAAGNEIVVTAKEGKKLTERQVAAAIRQAKKDGNLSGDYFEVVADSLIDEDGDVYTSSASGPTTPQLGLLPASRPPPPPSAPPAPAGNQLERPSRRFRSSPDET